LYPTLCTTPKQRNGYDCGVFSILFAIHIGLRLNINNINQTQILAIRCQMLPHLLKIAPAEKKNEVLPVRPAIRETKANNPLLLSDDSEDNSDERSAHINGVMRMIMFETMMRIDQTPAWISLTIAGVMFTENYVKKIIFTQQNYAVELCNIIMSKPM
jgi:hypothetical protein